MDSSTDVFQCLTESIDAALSSVLAAGAPRHGDQPAAEVGQAEVSRLEADRAVVALHSRVADQQVTYGQASFCRECGEPAPCPTIRDLAERYGCADI